MRHNLDMCFRPDPKPPKTYRNDRMLAACRELPCQVTDCGVMDGSVVACHSNQLSDGKGRGLKAHDFRVAACCGGHHYEMDQGSKMSREERRDMWEQAHRSTIGELFLRGVIGVL